MYKFKLFIAYFRYHKLKPSQKSFAIFTSQAKEENEKESLVEVDYVQ